MKIIDYSNICNVEKVNGLYVLKHPVFIDFEYNGTLFRIMVDAGAMTDGLSVPKIFQWYLPAWDKNNVLYNIRSEFVTMELMVVKYYLNLLLMNYSMKH